jgi:hypothetical protein
VINVLFPFFSNFNIPNLEGSVYWKGWIKYFHYTYSTNTKKPKKFHENPEYFHQKTLGENYHSKVD